jgi:hypothetical protein
VESEKFCKIFWELNKAYARLTAEAERRQQRNPWQEKDSHQLTSLSILAEV